VHKYIIELAENGIKTFPCNKDKTPAVGSGFYASTSDITKLEKMFYKDDLLIGLPTGNVNKIVVIDIDVNKKIPGTDKIDQRTVTELIEDLQDLLGIHLPETIQVDSPSGGRHLYYKVESTDLNSATHFFDKTLPIDIRANGGYIIFPDDINYLFYDNYDEDIVKGFYHKLPLLPIEISSFKKTKMHSGSDMGDDEDYKEPLPENEIKEIRSALSYISSDNRDEWIKIGMILKSTGSKAAYGLWNEWSQTSDKYNPNDMEKRWSGLKPTDLELGSLFYMAKEKGWSTTYQNQPSLPNTEINIETIKKKIETKKPVMDKELLHPPGLVGDMVEYMQQCAIKPQPIFALAASLCAIGALQGRKIETNTGVRTNIYCLGVGPAGCGKESPRKVIKRCFDEIGAGQMCSVEELASDASVITELGKVGLESQIFLLDEIGRFLRTTSEQKNNHLYNIVSVLLKLYSSSNSIYYGKSYADETKRKKIINPNLCLYGTTVPKSLYKGMTIDHLQNGFLSRILIFESDDDPRKKRRNNIRSAKPPVKLLEQLSLWYKKDLNSHPAGNMGHMLVNPDIVPITENAVDILEDFEDYLYNIKKEIPDEFKSIYVRTSELAEKIALIVAAGRNFYDPVISPEDVIYGIKLTKYLSEYLLYVAQNFMADNQYEHELKNILKIIRTEGKIQKSKLGQKTQHLQTYLRNDIIDNLKVSNQIAEVFEGNGVMKTTFFVAM